MSRRLPEDFGGKPGSAGLPVTLTEKDELGTIKPVNLIENYQEVFHQQMIQPILEGKKVPWDRFLPDRAGGHQPLPGYELYRYGHPGVRPRQVHRLRDLHGLLSGCGHLQHHHRPAHPGGGPALLQGL
jgi:hypothetical protein